AGWPKRTTTVAGSCAGCEAPTPAPAGFGLRRRRRRRCPISASSRAAGVPPWGRGHRLRAILAGRRVVRPALRRVGHLRREDDGHLLPPELSRADAETLQRGLLLLGRRRPGGGLSCLQAL